MPGMLIAAGHGDRPETHGSAVANGEWTRRTDTQTWPTGSDDAVPPEGWMARMRPRGPRGWSVPGRPATIKKQWLSTHPRFAAGARVAQATPCPHLQGTPHSTAGLRRRSSTGFQTAGDTTTSLGAVRSRSVLPTCAQESRDLGTQGIWRGWLGDEKALSSQDLDKI